MKKIVLSTATGLLLLIVLVSTVFASERQLLLKGSLQDTETQLNIPTLSATGSATLVAADGSSLFGEGTGQGTPTGTPGIVSIVETYTITGGTGRFAGATGSFTVERLIDRATLTSSGTLSGTIVLP